MLIPREELSFDFKGASFDVSRESDRKFLAWTFNQFLYGEVTGIQCGHWLYRAPHLGAATFLAKQASEELSHVRKILRILSILGEKPAPAHSAIRFLSTGMMGQSWGEHVALEMALGEGLVLTVFYALADTIAQPEIRKILENALAEEERHVVFGEKETIAWLKDHPEDRRFLFGAAVIQVYVLHRLKKFMARKLLKGDLASHPVLSRFEAFYDHVLAKLEARIDRLGLSRRPMAEMGSLETWMLMLSHVPGQLVRKFARKAPLLTTTYLQDPWVKAEGDRFSNESV